MQQSSMHLVRSNGSRPVSSEQRRVAVVGGHGGRRFVERLAARPGGGLSVDVLVSDPAALMQSVGGMHPRVRVVLVPDLASVSRGDLIARYDAVVYALESFRERPLPTSGAGLAGNVWADEVADNPGLVSDWTQAIVVGSGGRACAAVRALTRAPSRTVGRDIVVLGGAARRVRTPVDALPARLGGTSVTVCSGERLAGIKGHTQVESVLTCGPDGATRLRPAQLVVNATGDLPAVLAGLPIDSTGRVFNEAGRIRGTAHEFVLGPLQCIGTDAVPAEDLAERIGERIDRCRGPWSAVDPREWLEFRHGAESAATPPARSGLAS